MKPTSLLSLALPFAVACTASHSAPSQSSTVEGQWPALEGTLVVVNQHDHNVRLLDLGTGATRKVIDTGKGPHEAAVSPNGKWIAVTNYGVQGGPGNSLTIIELPKAEVVKTVSLGSYIAPHGIEWIDNDKAIVTSEATENLVIVNITKGEVEKALKTGQKGSHLLALAKDRKRVYSGNVHPGNVTAFDMETGTKLWDVEAGPGSEGIGISPDGKQVWTGNRGDHTVTVINTATKERSKVIKCEGMPYRVTFTPDGKFGVVAAPVGSAIVLIDSVSLQEAKRIDLSGAGFKFGNPKPGGAGLVVDPTGRYLFTTVVNSASVAVVDLQESKVIARTAVGNSPDGVAISPIKVAR